MAITQVKVRFPMTLEQQATFASLYQEFRKYRYGTDHGVEPVMMGNGAYWELIIEHDGYKYIAERASAHNLKIVQLG